MRSWQFLSMGVAAFLGMGIAIAVSVCLYTGHRYHLSIGVDTDHDDSIQPSMLRENRESMGDDSARIADDPAGSINRWQTESEPLLDLPNINLNMPELPQVSFESRIPEVVSTREEATRNYAPNAKLIPASYPSGVSSVHVLRQQSEEIHRLAKQVERLQELLSDQVRNAAAAEREGNVLGDASESFDQQPQLRSNMQGSSSMIVEEREPASATDSIQRTESTEEKYLQNCEELDELLARMEQIQKQLDTSSEQIDSDLNHPAATRDRKPKIRQSAYVDDEEVEEQYVPSKLIRKHVSTRPIEMKIIPAARPPRP